MSEAFDLPGLPDPRPNRRTSAAQATAPSGQSRSRRSPSGPSHGPGIDRTARRGAANQNPTCSYPRRRPPPTGRSSAPCAQQQPLRSPRCSPTTPPSTSPRSAIEWLPELSPTTYARQPPQGTPTPVRRRAGVARQRSRQRPVRARTPSAPRRRPARRERRDQRRGQRAACPLGRLARAGAAVRDSDAGLPGAADVPRGAHRGRRPDVLASPPAAAPDPRRHGPARGDLPT